MENSNCKNDTQLTGNILKSINKKIKPLRMKTKITQHHLPLINTKSSENVDNQTGRKQRNIHRKSKFQRHHSIGHDNEQLQMYNTLQKKVHEHIIMQKLNMMQKTFLNDDKYLHHSSPFEKYIDLFKKGEKLDQNIYEGPARNTYKYESQDYKIQGQNWCDETKKKVRKMQRRLKKLIQRDMVKEYKDQSNAKLKNAINHQKLIKMR